MRARRTYYVYIMGSISGTLYIGITGNLHKRAFEQGSTALKVSRTITMLTAFFIGNLTMTFTKRLGARNSSKVGAGRRKLC